jgi:hypothetical protein
MAGFRIFFVTIASTFGLLLPVCPSMAATIDFTGTFTTDGQVNYYALTLGSTSDVTLETYSYGGSTATNPATPAGGFLPVISLFDASGAFLGSSDTNGVCGAGQNPDPTTGYCGDAFLMESGLAAGNYFAALSEFPNVPNTPNLSDGFLFAGMPAITGDVCGVSGGMFLDSLNFDQQGGCAQRNGDFTLSLQGVTSASQSQGAPSSVPEPATLFLTAPVLAWFVKRGVSANEK